MKKHNTISQEELEQIEAWLAGEMTEEEHAAFQARLATDALLREKVDEARVLIVGIREAALMDKLDSFHAGGDTKIHVLSKRKPTTRYWMAAASVIVIAVATFFVMRSGGSEDKLFANYFEPDPGLATTMSSTEYYVFNRGMIDYKTGNYKAAIETWRPLITAEPGNDTLHYFSGISFLALKEMDSAAHHLRVTVIDMQSSFRSDAMWYLALALIYQNKTTEAISLLQQTNHPKKDELLSQIK